jgi:serine/threonine-protein kinase
MELYCTRSGCPRPVNSFAELDDLTVLKRVSQKYCTACGMPLILRDRYLPGKLLGKGGFGVAVLARDRDTPTKRSCVVKVFRPPENLTPNQLQKAQNLFEREAAVLEQLGNEHPQIPELYAFFELSVLNRISGKEDQFFYLVQEFINGQTLEEEQKRKGKFLEDEVEGILREILQVLQFVHEKGTIHRDIKPSNIMRDRQGRLYLLDFGAVKQVTSVPVSGISLKSTGIIYTPGYAPPEQMSGSQVYPATDLYALAVTCLTLLTGKSPQELYDSYNSQWRWRNYVQVSDRLATVLDRMLLSVPQQRFPSAASVDIFLQEVTKSENFAANVELIGTTTQALRKIASTPGSIYFASAPEVVPQCTIKPIAIGRKPDEFVTPYQEPFVPLSQCPTRRNQLNQAAFQQGKYPLTRNLFVVLKQNGQIEQQAGEAYANLLLTGYAQELISKAGFVPLALVEINLRN